MAGSIATEVQKAELLNRLYSLWCAYPHLRLGQLIGNGYPQSQIYYVEDGALLEHLERFYHRREESPWPALET